MRAAANRFPFPVHRERRVLLISVAADEDGLCLFAKRLDRGRFVGPQAAR